MKDVDSRVFTRMLWKDGRKEGQMDGSVTISHRNFVGEGIITLNYGKGILTLTKTFKPYPKILTRWSIAAYICTISVFCKAFKYIEYNIRLF